VRNLRLIRSHIMHYFLHFGVHENAFTITQNALILQLLGASPPQTPSRDSAPCTPAGGQPSTPFAAPTRSSRSATDPSIFALQFAAAPRNTCRPTLCSKTVALFIF